MKRFDSNGVEIAYIDEGTGDPIVLIHGFASNAKFNWVDPGWVRLLTEAGRRVIAVDTRGHGNSQKLYDLNDYGAPVMASDLRASAALIIAGLAAKGRTEIHRMYHLERGYESLDEKLSGLGATVYREEE